MDRINLYIGSCMGELNRKSTYKFDPTRGTKMHINHSEKTFQAAEEARLKGDEERGYILYMRYIDIFQKIRNSQGYKKDESHFSLLLGSTKLKESLAHAEKLSESLRKRYEEKKQPAAKDIKNNSDAKTDGATPDLNLKGITEDKPALVVSKRSMPDKLKSIPDDAKSISCKMLYELLFSKQEKNCKALLIDIRHTEEFDSSKMKHPDCINISKTLIKPGTICKRIESGISNEKDLQLWKQRAEVDIIVLIDWYHKIKDLDDLDNPLRSLTDALVKWEQEVFLKRNPVILSGGYSDWLDYYPQFTTNPKIKRPVPQSNSQTNLSGLSDFSFADLIPGYSNVNGISAGNSDMAEETEPLPSPKKDDEKNGTITSSVGTEVAKPGQINDSRQSQNQNDNISHVKAPRNPPAPMHDFHSTAKDWAKKNTPTVDRTTKPVMPYPVHASALPLKDEEAMNVSKQIIPSDTDRAIAEIRSRLDASKKKKELEESKTRELEEKKRLIELQALEKRMQIEAEQEEKRRKDAETNLANAMRELRNDQKNSKGYEDPPTATTSSLLEIKRDGKAHQDTVTPGKVNVTQPLTIETSNTTKIKKDAEPCQDRVSQEKSDGIPSAHPRENSEKNESSKVEEKIHARQLEKDMKKEPTQNEKPEKRMPPANPKPSLRPAAPKPDINMTVGKSDGRRLPKAAESPKNSKKDNEKVADIVRSKNDQKLRKTSEFVKVLESEGSSCAGATNLPLNWEKRLDKQTGRYFYLDHSTKTTHWMLPTDVVTSKKKSSTRNAADGGGLKRSSSSPNIAQLVENERSAWTKEKPVVPNRQIKPSPQDKSTSDRPDEYANRLPGLHPATGGRGPGLCGLQNLGNTCYMNSVLQCMFNTALLVRYFLSNQYKRDINRENFLGSGGEITDGFALLMKAAWDGQFKHLTPREFRQTISRFNPRFAGYSQQDSQELLLFLMDGLHEDLNLIKNRKYEEEKDNDNLGDGEAASCSWEYHKRLNKSIIVELFQGQFKATVQCIYCKKTSRKFDVFMYLSLPLPAHNCSIHECIQNFSEVEKLCGDNKWRCPSCKTERDAIRRMEIWKLPPVLLIHFKRFSFCGRWGDKVQTAVKFPATGLDLSRYVKGPNTGKLYELYSVSHHHGTSLDSGHYIASCKNPTDGNWYKYDDHEVSRTSVPQGSSAYILCYTSVGHTVSIVK